MKVLNKKNVVQEKLIEHIAVERDVMLSMGHHPFIIKLNFAFQTDDQLFFILDYVGGGSLLQHLQQVEEGCFSPTAVKFYAAEILLGIQSLHSNKIIYRDLKLENILLSKEGHVVLTDFGLSAKLKTDKSKVNSFSGTAIYLAPEILLDKSGEGHGKSVDWWAFGVLLHILFTGSPPFWSENFKELFDFILTQPLTFDDPNLTPEAIDLITQLLDRDTTKRLGCSEGGAEDIKKHPFFGDVDWEEVYNKTIPPPIVPKFDAAEEAKKIFDPNEKISIGRKKKEDKRFRGFSYMGGNNVSPLLKISEDEKELWKLDDSLNNQDQQYMDSSTPSSNQPVTVPSVAPTPSPSPSPSPSPPSAFAKPQGNNAFKKGDLLKKPRQSIALGIKSKLTKKRSAVTNPMSPLSPKADSPHEKPDSPTSNNAFANNNSTILSPKGKSTPSSHRTTNRSNKIDTKSDVKSEVKFDTKPDIKSNNKGESKAEIKSPSHDKPVNQSPRDKEVKFDKPEPKGNKLESKSEPKVESKPENKLENKSSQEKIEVDQSPKERKEGKGNVKFQSSNSSPLITTNAPPSPLGKSGSVNTIDVPLPPLPPLPPSPQQQQPPPPPSLDSLPPLPSLPPVNHSLGSSDNIIGVDSSSITDIKNKRKSTLRLENFLVQRPIIPVAEQVIITDNDKNNNNNNNNDITNEVPTNLPATDQKLAHPLQKIFTLSEEGKIIEEKEKERRRKRKERKKAKRLAEENNTSNTGDHKPLERMDSNDKEERKSREKRMNSKGKLETQNDTPRSREKRDPARKKKDEKSSEESSQKKEEPQSGLKKSVNSKSITDANNKRKSVMALEGFLKARPVQEQLNENVFKLSTEGKLIEERTRKKKSSKTKERKKREENESALLDSNRSSSDNLDIEPEKRVKKRKKDISKEKINTGTV